jgi:hypothetical protein
MVVLAVNICTPEAEKNLYFLEILLTTLVHLCTKRAKKTKE